MDFVLELRSVCEREASQESLAHVGSEQFPLFLYRNAVDNALSPSGSRSGERREIRRLEVLETSND